MSFTLTISDTLIDQLTAAIFSDPDREGAAYLLCGVSSTEEETRLLGRGVIPVTNDHYLIRESYRLSIASDSYVPIAKRARTQGEAVIFVHSHPEHIPDFSTQDDIEEPKLHAFFHSRAPGLPHGSMVFNSPTMLRGRIFGADGKWISIDRIRVLGRRFRFIDRLNDEAPLPEFFDRQVRAFGPDIQRLLRRLHIGVVGAGGTGSPIIEQLSRLGVGRLSVFDGEKFDTTNATRVYGSSLADEGRPKVLIQQEHIERIGFGTELYVFQRPITEEAIAKELRRCDIIFGCTDKHAPRGILVRIALRYLIPVFDMGVKIDSAEGAIRGIWGRVTTLMPGEACLFCRQRIDPKIIRAEALPPDQREQELDEGYIPRLATAEPAVVMFTTAVAAQAINELLHRLTGFMGTDRQSSETILFFHESRVRTNRQPPKLDCLCQVEDHWGRGDSKDFLGRVW